MMAARAAGIPPEGVVRPPGSPAILSNEERYQAPPPGAAEGERAPEPSFFLVMLAVLGMAFLPYSGPRAGGGAWLVMTPLCAILSVGAGLMVLGPRSLESAIPYVCLLLAGLHALIVQGQTRIDQLDRDLAVVSAESDRLLLRLAELESPERVVAEARLLGMVDAPAVVYLTPTRPAPRVEGIER